MSDLLLVFVALSFVIAGFVKGVIGLGLPTVAIGLLGLALPAAEAASLLVVPSLVTNVWQLASGPHLLPLMRLLWPLLAGICAGSAAGTAVLGGIGAPGAGTALGVTLALYALIGLAAPRAVLPPSAEPLVGPFAGLATGVVTVVTGVFAIPAVPYIQALGLAKEELVQALGLSFTISTVALAASLAATGALPPSVAGASMLALAPALAGMMLGRIVLRRIAPATFRIWFLLGLLGLGLHLALRG